MFSIEPICEEEREPAVALPFGFLPDSYAQRRSIAVFVHLFYEEVAYEILAYVNNLPLGADLFVTTDTQQKAVRFERIFEGYKFGKVTVRVVPNRGRDIAPKLLGFREAYDEYEFVLHVHSKKSVHNSRLASWRTYLFESLCGSPSHVRDILEIFSRAPNVGMVFPQHYEYIRRWVSWEANFDVCRQLALRLGYDLVERHPLDFPSGSMFWARSAALRPLLDLGWTFDDFPDEAGQQDSTLAHAVERLYAIVCELSGHDWVKIARPELLTDRSGIVSMVRPEDLDNFLATRIVRLTAGGYHKEIANYLSAEAPLAPELESITEAHNQLLKQAENVGRWTKTSVFPFFQRKAEDPS